MSDLPARPPFSDRIRAIRALADNATRGPWVFVDSSPEEYTVRATGPVISGIVATVSLSWVHGEQRAEQFANARFIQHAREDVPWLLDRLDAAERCPWCRGSGVVELGGWPDVNGYERQGPCACGDGTADGAFRHLVSQNRELRERADAAEARVAEQSRHLLETIAVLSDLWVELRDGERLLAMRAQRRREMIDRAAAIVEPTLPTAEEVRGILLESPASLVPAEPPAAPTGAESDTNPTPIRSEPAAPVVSGPDDAEAESFCKGWNAGFKEATERYDSELSRLRAALAEIREAWQDAQSGFPARQYEQNAKRIDAALAASLEPT